MTGVGAPPQPRVRPWLVLVVLCMGSFMVLLDGTIIYIAIPSIVGSLGTRLDQVFWVLSAYTLTFAVLLIAGGRLGDRIGQRNAFVAGIALFTLASAAAGLAGSTNQLIAARLAQGVGGALLSPQALAIVATIFPANRRGAAFGIWVSITGLATIVAPTLGGLLITFAGWRWIFFINVPIGIVVLALALLTIPDMRPGRHTSIEPVGLLLAGAALFLITFALIEGQPYHWGLVTTVAGIPITIVAILVAGLALLVPLIAWDRTRSAPLLPAALFRNRDFAVMAWVAANVSVATLGLFLPLTVFLQSVLGFTAIAAGLALLPVSLVSALAAPGTGRLADRVDARHVLVTGLLLLAAGIGFIAWRASSTSDWLSLLPGTVLAGFGLGCTYAPLGAIALRNVQPQLAGAASGMLSTVRQLGALVGSAVVGAVLQNRLATGLRDQAAASAQQLPAGARVPFVDAFRAAADRGVEIGPSATAVSVHVPGAASSLSAEVTRLAHEVFAQAFIGAMRATLLVPVAALVVAAISAAAIRTRRLPKPTPSVDPLPVVGSPPTATPRSRS